MKGSLSPFHQGVKLVSFCPLCEAKYDVKTAKVLDEKEDAQLLHITCVKCKASVLAVILLNNLGVTSIGLVSDLSTDEVLKFKDLTSITSEEVLELHEALHKSKDSEFYKKFNIIE